MRTEGDYDGWHDESFRVVATLSWKGAASGKKTWSPNHAWGSLCV